MSSPAPIYTAENSKAAYQLNWSLALFWRAPIQDANWLTDLKATTEPDGVRILEHRFVKSDVSQFLLSTRPDVAPKRQVWSVKGRLQHLVQSTRPKAFQRNYGLRTLGSTSRDVIEHYVREQVAHHPPADPRVRAMLDALQVDNQHVDLSTPCRTTHAIYWYNLHVCFVSDGRCREIRRETLAAIRAMILRAAEKKQHRLSRAAILPDHVHLTLGCNVDESPGEVALSYMNNLAYACGSKRIFAPGYYVGTFGEYDLGVTWL